MAKLRKPTSILELLNLIELVTGRQAPYQLVDHRPGDPPALYAEPRLARELLGWSPRYTLDTALRSAWEWENVGLPKLQEREAESGLIRAPDLRSHL